jgi:hypothetical protein
MPKIIEERLPLLVRDMQTGLSAWREGLPYRGAARSFVRLPGGWHFQQVDRPVCTRASVLRSGLYATDDTIPVSP